MKSAAETFCEKWLSEHCQEQPRDKEANLTWFVACHALYAPYLKATYLAKVDPVASLDLSKAVLRLFPRSRLQMLRKHQIYSGVRFFRDKLGGELFFGL